MIEVSDIIKSLILSIGTALCFSIIMLFIVMPCAKKYFQNKRCK